ncbi:hypothetical protein RQP46_010533 [Phenoliferia psychrophenolica]
MEDTPRSKPLPPPPELPFPSSSAVTAALSTEVDSDLALDARSIEHLGDLLKQSLAGVKLKEEVWLAPFLAALDSLSDYLTPTILAQIVESSAAQSKARDHLAKAAAASATAGGASGSKKGKEKDKERDKDKPAATPTRADTPLQSASDDKAAEERRATWSAARDLLQRGPPTPSSSSSAEVLPDSQSPPEPEGTTGEKEDDPEHPRLAHFRLALRTHETTSKLLRTNPDLKIGLAFVPDSWTSDQSPLDQDSLRPLFGRDSFDDLDELDRSHVRLFGGTLELTAYSKDLSKLERVLELAAFATLSLKLEAHLLRDTSCPRPLLSFDDTPDPDNEEDFASSSAASSHFGGTINSSQQRTPTPSLANTIEADDDFPTSVESSPTKKGHKSRWSSSNIWGLIRGATSVATSSLAPPPDESHQTGGATTPTGRVKDRLKVLGGGIKLRKSRIRGSRRDASDSSGRPSMDMEALDNWDFVGGLGLAGLGFEDYNGLSSLEEPSRREEGRGGDGKKDAAGKKDVDDEPTERFQKVIKKMEACILSTSPNVIFPPPHLLVRLRKQEVAQLSASLPTSDKTPTPSSFDLSPPVPPKPVPFLSPLGWPSRPPVERLRSYTTVDARTLALGMHFLVETACQSAGPTAPACKPPTWLTFDYWDASSPTSSPSSDRPDVTLGQLIERLVHNREVPCDTPTCKLSTLSPASYAFSFAKYAELVLYNSDFVPSPELCEHASHDRNALVRSFAVEGTVVSLGVDQIELFELRLPTSVDPLVAPPIVTTDDLTSVEQLRSEIESFYTSVRDRLDFLADFIPLASNTIKKAPPPAPKAHIKAQSDDTVLGGDDDLDPASSTVKKGGPFRLIGQLRSTVDADEAALLSDCLSSVTSPSLLNQGRYEFLRRANAIKARVAAWESKHATSLESASSSSGDGQIPPPVYAQADYFSPDVHVFPIDSAVLVRETELSSAIALTLSAPAFQAEITALSAFATRKPTPSGYFSTPSPSVSRHTSSRHPIPLDFLELSTAATAVSPDGTPPKSPRLLASPTLGFSSSHSKKSSPIAPLDPDDPLADFGTDDPWTGEAKPKKEQRGGSMLASMRGGITRQKSSDSGSFGFFRSPLLTPTTEQSPDHGHGHGGHGGRDADDASQRKAPSDSVLEDLVATSHGPLPSPSPRLAATKTPGGALPQIMSGLAGKRHVSETALTSSVYATAEVVAGPGGKSASTAASMRSSSSSLAEDGGMRRSSGAEDDDELTAEELENDVAPLELPERPGSRLVNAIWSLGSLRGSRGSGFTSSPGPAAEGAHIKYKFSHGDKSFRVTCWYAEKFQKLRSCCGLSEDLFIESLSRCTDLNPSGGKSKSAFWMTGDRRFMLKELVNAWGVVSEKDAFLTFAPELLKHLMATERPSLLAKIFGFYTVKTKNLKTGETRRLDLIVMEHLFHSQTITRQFDLKGVAGRVAKSKTAGKEADGKESQSQQTLWDGDWLAGSLQSRLLIYSHSKTLLRDALLNDSTFLAKCGNIDYSLLVGVNDTTHELVVGLIDIISVFNLAKMLENAGKTALKKATQADADSVTVLPPADYALRFRQAMEKYFIAVPEKFSRGVEEMDPDPRLASVL